MSGFEVFGAVVGTISIVGFLIKNYADLKDADLPRGFREVAERLALIQDTLQSIEEWVKQSEGEESLQGIRAIVEKCKDKADLLEKIFKDMIPADGVPRFERYRAAVQRLSKGSHIEELTKGMMEDLRLLAENRAFGGATEAQVAKVLQAIEDMSAMEPSVPDEDVSPHYVHYGSGSLNVHSGTGTHYHASGVARVLVLIL